MPWLEGLLDATPRFENAPKPFGAFHIASVVIILALAVLMAVFRKHLPKGEKALRLSLAVFGIGLLFLEVGKQIAYSYTPSMGWSYNWDRFPFQFCSTPIYVALVAMCLPSCRLRRSLTAFLGIYSPAAGWSVLFYPSASVFHKIIFLDVQTMLWHGGMLLFGLYLWLCGEIKPTLSSALGALLVYLPIPPIALLLNEAEHIWGFAGEYTFNMLYISRFGYCPIPVLSFIQQHAPYPVFFLSYVLLLGAGGMLIFAAMWGIEQLSLKLKTQKRRVENENEN